MAPPSGPVSATAAREPAESEAMCRWGVATSWKSATAALQGDQTTALLTGDTFTTYSRSGGMFVDLPISTGHALQVYFRIQAMVHQFRGHIGEVTLAQLRDISPGIASLILRSFNDLQKVPGGKNLQSQGKDLLNEIIANEVTLKDDGVDLGFLFFVNSAPFPLFEAFPNFQMEFFTFGIGGSGHLSSMEIEIQRDHHCDSATYFGFGGGLLMQLAVATIYLKNWGLRIQPAAAEFGLSALFSREDLRAILVEANLKAQLSFEF